VTLVLKTDPVNPDPHILREAAGILKKGGYSSLSNRVTVYGLGAIVYNEEAVKKIFWAKMRPMDNPLIIHISSIDMLEEVAVNIPEKAYRLIERFLAGPSNPHTT